MNLNKKERVMLDILDRNNKVVAVLLDNGQIIKKEKGNSDEIDKAISDKLIELDLEKKRKGKKN